MQNRKEKIWETCALIYTPVSFRNRPKIQKIYRQVISAVYVYTQDAAQKRAIVTTFFPEPLGWGTCCHLHKGGGHL
jgi:hypothetical protein